MTFAHPPHKFHLLSQTLLRRFCDGTKHLSVMQVGYPDRPAKPRSPAAVGYTTELAPKDPFQFEQVWTTVEDRLPEAFAALEAGSIVGNEDLLGVLRDCLALHFARSRTLEAMTKPMIDKALDDAVLRMMNDPRLRSNAGVYPAGPEGAKIMAEQMRQRIMEKGFTPAGMLPDAFVRNFHTCKERVKDHPLELLVAQEGEFLIGDAPAQTLGEKGLGVLGGVAWDQADTVFMPVGPWHAIALAPLTKYVELEQDVVTTHNAWQVARAQRHVMWRTGAELEGFVRTELEKMA